ncbi:polysaccharide deacetylase family protein [Streptomyces sp. A3M-1-3]|uniref:polysaccharide deacetylase family protein n=1 Tax=Streptomyces sp. A3M-1-3 TaxID=2962044 RepID=UPI0020B71DC8|nr:polysaccharide deacetylase family protein [Streptomyces sp. A3M-1-3]MCP3818202.1 polysaccharide deacetylase family protein [Streptomyces sp. A3M-1-3]
MKNDEPPIERRALLRAAVCLGAIWAAGALIREQTGGPPGPDAPGAPPAAGPGVGPGVGTGVGSGAGVRVSRPLGPASYRLRPMAAHAPQRYRPGLPPVRRKPILRLPPHDRSMVLTFDDGPDPRYTPAILRTLRRHEVRAMFFVCGEMAVDNRDLLREMADDGHVVGNHSWSHPLLTRLRRRMIAAELGRTSDLVARTTGMPPVWFRAPYGAWNRWTFEIGAELGMEPLAWTVDTLDWTEPGTGTIVRRVREGAGPGVVVLSHDAGGDRSQSVRALRRYLPELLDAGYGVTLPVLPAR